MNTETKIFHMVIAAAMLYTLGMPLQAQESTGTSRTESTEQMPGTRQIGITASDYKFTPSEFTVPAGVKVTVTLTNKAHKAHNIEFEISGKKVKLSRDIGFNESASLEFTAPGPGTYSFKCPVDLHSTFGMKGKMFVR